MGSNGSRAGDSDRSVFNGRENEEVDILFKNISRNEETFGLTQFKEFLQPKVSDYLCVRLYHFMKSIATGENYDRSKKSPPKSDHITRICFAHSLGTIFKGTNDQKAKFLISLMVEAKVDPLRNVLNEILRLADLSLMSVEEYLSWKFQPKFTDDQLVNHFLFDLVMRDGQQQCDVREKLSSDAVFTPEDIEMWLTRMPLVVHLMELAFHYCFPIRGSPSVSPHLLPHCDPGVVRSAVFTALDFLSVMFINSALPHTLRSEWRLLYCCSLHGASFATMLKKIVNEGPTVLVVKDREGHIFGGFAAESWMPNAQFYGSSHCFLFSLKPIMDVYYPTGYNSNFIYVNQNQQTLPNGLGMGGQWGYAGLWINDTFGSGHSKAGPKCTTYNSPQLSSTAEFSFDVMEVWAVGRKQSGQEEEEEKDPKKKSGLLKMDVETKAVLEMAGKEQHSEGFREREHPI